MTKTRISQTFFKSNALTSFSKILMGGLGCCSFMLSGCIAQQADLNRLKRELNDEIVQIQEEKKALQYQVDRAREAIAEGEKQTAELRAENKKLFKSRAEFNQKIREFRERDLAEVNGQIERVNKRVDDLQGAVQSQNDQVDSRIQGMEAQVDARFVEVETHTQAQQQELMAQQTQTTALIEQVDQDATSFTEKMTEFQAALTAFKQSLAELGNKFVQEAERDSHTETELSQQLAQNAQASQAVVEEMQRHLAANSANIDQVSQSVSTMKEAVDQSGTLLGSRLDEEAARVALLETKQSQLETDILTLTEKLNTDTQALKTYLEQDVQTSMNAMVVTMKEHQQPLVQRVDAVQGDLEGHETQLATQSDQIQELTQIALQLREHQDVMGSLLGKRGDDLVQQAGRFEERMRYLETHQSALDQTIETNRQNTTRHLNELTASLASMNQALQETTSGIASQLTSHEESLNALTQQIQGLQAIQGKLETNQGQIQSLIHSDAEFRKSVQQVTNRLMDLEKHQSAITEKIDADFQAINTHLTKVHSAITSEKEALAQVNTQVNARIDKQEEHLNKALTRFQAVQGVKEASESNRNHLNQLNETVNKLREVLTTIGTKFGERVDQHEARISELAKRVNQLQAKKVKK